MGQKQAEAGEIAKNEELPPQVIPHPIF